MANLDGEASLIARSRAVTDAPSSGDAASEHIRGSSLLLAGRFIAFGLEFAAQVMLVRYLSKSDFGALSYALSIVVLLKSVAVLELPNTLARFIPVYRESRIHGALVGSVALAMASVLALGVLMAVMLYVASGQNMLQLTDDPRAMLLLTALALLVPVEGLDALLTAILSTLAGAAQIAFRQVFAPALKLGIVLVMIFLGADVIFLATGYVVAAILSVLVYALLLFQLVRKQSWLSPRVFARVSFPFREVYGFALPLLAATVVWLFMESSDTVILGYYQGTGAVASFRAVLPLPRVLVTLTFTFAVLYTPLAARLYARRQHQDLADLYRSAALWMTVLSFPIFAMGFSFARTTTIELYGTRYADSAPLMSILSLGYYFFAVTGFNGMTLKICGKLRYAVGIDVAAAIVNLAVNLALIPHWGATGAAIGTCATMIVHNIMKQYGLWKYLKVNLFVPGHMITYVSAIALALTFLVVQSLVTMTLPVVMGASVLGGALIFWVSRRQLRAETIFPEVRTLAAAAGILHPRSR